MYIYMYIYVYVAMLLFQANAYHNLVDVIGLDQRSASGRINVKNRKLITGDPRRGRRVKGVTQTPMHRNDTCELSTIASLYRDAIRIDVLPVTQPIDERHDDEEVTDDDRECRLEENQNKVNLLTPQKF